MSSSNVSQRIALVTGATDGIGKATAAGLLKRGFFVIFHGRSAEKIDCVLKEVGATPENAAAICADFSSLQEVQNMVKEINQRYSNGGLDVLVNNAGVYVDGKHTSKDGYELTLAVNYLAPFLLTNGILPLLTKKTTSGGEKRIVNVSSLAHTKYPNGVVDEKATFDFDNINGEKSFDTYTAYAQSKLLNVLHANALSRQLHSSSATSHVTVNSLHPGVINTKLFQELLHQKNLPLKGDPDWEAGAATSIYLASSKEVNGVTGKYFADCKEAWMHPLASDLDTMQKVWKYGEEACKKF